MNARSLTNKLPSFENILNELIANICLVTETWFKDSALINRTLEDFTNKSGYAFLRKDRGGGRHGGGICICFDPERIQLSKAKIPPTKHEVYAVIGQRRKIALLVVYVPPG